MKLFRTLLILFALSARAAEPEIHVFIHACLIGDWHIILGKQMRRLKASGLYDHATSISIGVLGTDGDIKPFFERYPKLKLLFHDSRKELFERPTLYALYDKCLASPNCLVLYFHTKGVTRPNAHPVRDWTSYLEYFNIDEWRDCVKALTQEDYDVCGVNWQGPPPHFSGNFWWAKASYITSLPRSIGYSYPGAPQLDPEMWLGQNDPYVKSFHTSGVNHYHENYPEERYRKTR